jgi:AAA+ superfamily predicted ATPase
MKTWIIKKNDFAIGESLGRNKAIRRIKLILDWEGVPNKFRKWGEDRVDAGGNVYTIEQSRG